MIMRNENASWGLASSKLGYRRPASSSRLQTSNPKGVESRVVRLVGRRIKDDKNGSCHGIDVRVECRWTGRMMDVSCHRVTAPWCHSLAALQGQAVRLKFNISGAVGGSGTVRSNVRLVSDAANRARHWAGGSRLQPHRRTYLF